MTIAQWSAILLAVVALLALGRAWPMWQHRNEPRAKTCHTSPSGTSGKGVLLGGQSRSVAAERPSRAKSSATVAATSQSPDSKGMVRIAGGEFWMGAQMEAMEDALPIHRVKLSGFYIDETEVTNDAYAEFVAATDYVTVAERTPRAEDFPDAPKENLVAGSAVFMPPDRPVPLSNHLQWWSYMPGANWRHPVGPRSNVEGYGRHPVVQVAYEDAEAYCKWKGKRLPTEAEFEYAARGGLDRKKFVWGDAFRPKGTWMANTWQGPFPYRNDKNDGFRATAPVKSFPSNGYGLYDMAGNVWEWCSDWYRHDEYRRRAARSITTDPRGPASSAESSDLSEPGVAKRVHRGGSFLCTDQYCTAYMPGARGKGAPDTGTNHVGFRCVRAL